MDRGINYSKHVKYERNLKNRSRAIEIHGTTCCICDFNFNDFYGEEIAMNYIEIYHLEPVSKIEKIIDPSKDLVPVCSNC